ncbi:C-C motif chemokine 25 [Pteronotus mesoamericanus]|uniref:C-C motif chemokine 25 n=1 Tax=Pteronotus mesoamericanus TaxID=1884717 RepID=UPI0023EBC173|nr:C-C motif chemokine 25 [Pteronotus parnellii mesoamericanus]
MNLWLLAYLVACFVGTWAPAVQAQGVFEDCCLAYNRHIKLQVLQHARSYSCQDVSRSCNLSAVIFHFPHKKLNVCGNPQAKWVQDGMRLLDARNKDLLRHRQSMHKAFRSCHSRGKLSSKTSRLLLSQPRGHTRSSKNALLPAPANPGS